MRSGTDRTGRRSANLGPPREEKTSRRHPEAGSAPRAPPPPARHTSYPHICEPAGMAPEGPRAKERRARGPQNGVRARRNGPRGASRQGATGSRVPKRGASPRRWPQRGLTPRSNGLAGPKTGCEPAKMATEGPHAKEQRARERQIGAWTANGRQDGSRAANRLAGTKQARTDATQARQAPIAGQHRQLTAGRILRLLITSGIFFAAKAPWRSEKNYLCGRRFGQRHPEEETIEN